MMDDPAALEKEWRRQIDAAQDTAQIEALRVDIFGRKGSLTTLLRDLSSLTLVERAQRGKQLNHIKQRSITYLESRRAAIAASSATTGKSMDVTLPISPRDRGSLHPVRRVMDDAVDIFSQMGFSLAFGPDVEDDFHNFSALNIGENHPARQMHDTFYLERKDDNNLPHLLRTHTSPVQIRTLMNSTPPVQIIAPGRTYRSDSDTTHTPMFHQIEGLAIGKDWHMGHLKGCLERFCRQFFARDDLQLRFRPSYFPFTEPSAEVDIGCAFEGSTLRLDRGGEWMEILGCGMVHPHVLKACGIDAGQWQGFAFGMGIERLAMLKYGIGDLRAFFRSDQRWLAHYGFSPLRST